MIYTKQRAGDSGRYHLQVISFTHTGQKNNNDVTASIYIIRACSNLCDEHLPVDYSKPIMPFFIISNHSFLLFFNFPLPGNKEGPLEITIYILPQEFTAELCDAARIK